MANIPNINRKHRIRVICEGYEDEAYFKRLMGFDVWDKTYQFFPVNVKGASNIPARFQSDYQNDSYEIILIFCDTDKAPYREYKLVKDKINKFLNKLKASEKLIMFANPCTMQIILSHFGEVSLKNQGKKTNADIIEKLTGVKDYDAHDYQINDVCNRIFRRTYSEMKERVGAINHPDTTSCSTNFIVFLDRFESNDAKWIATINKYLKEQYNYRSAVVLKDYSTSSN